MKNLFVIDGSAILYRCFYAISPLHNSKGVGTHAILGFCKTLQKLVKEFACHNLVVCWDYKSTKRKEIYPEYKANRQKAPSDLIVQKEKICQILRALDIAQLQAEGYEADDLIATLVHIEKNAKIYIVTSDKDLFQLVNEQVIIVDPNKWLLYGPQEVNQKFGFGPEKIMLFYSLLGDASDNIPGVTGVGEKTASKLVSAYGSLKEIYQHIDQVTPEKLRQNLIKDRDNAFLSQELFTPMIVPDISLEQITPTTFQGDFVAAREILEELEIKALGKFAPKYTDTFGTEKSQDNPELNCILINTIGELEKLTVQLEKAQIVALDLETTGLDWNHDQIVGVSIGFDDNTGYYLPFGHRLFEAKTAKNPSKGLFDIEPEEQDKSSVLVQLDEEPIKQLIKKLLQTPGQIKIFHNAKFDLQFIANQWKVVDWQNIFDTAIGAKLLTPEWYSIGLKEIAKSLFNIDHQPCKELLKIYKNFCFVPLDVATPYAATDAIVTLKAFIWQEAQWQKFPELKTLYIQTELPLMQILAKMEILGIQIDQEMLQRLQDSGAKLIEKTRYQIMELIADIDPGMSTEQFNLENINLNSPKQIEHLLYNILQLPASKKNAKSQQRSTDSETLEKLTEMHPIINHLLIHRKIQKLQGTYLLGLQDYVDKNGLIHTQYNQTAVATGRLSSLNPNLQNIPTIPEFDLPIRAIFVARPDKVLISADYSQIELRILAQFCQDEHLLDAFKHDKDIHMLTAVKLFKKPAEEISKHQRDIAKRINFSILYGLSAYSLSQELKIGRQQAQDYIETFFLTYPAVRPWMQSILDQAKTQGYTTTWFGRRRWFRNINDQNKIIAQAEERAAINSVVQGTAADLIKMAMVKIEQRVQQDNLKLEMLLQIHDEIVFECAPEFVDQAKTIISQVMESIVQWNIPLTVGISSGNNWQDL